jgi:hypothetical protein
MMRRGPQEGDSVTIIREGSWQMDMDGRVESKTDIGRSEDGFHYKTSSTDNHTFDNEGSWSKPFKTQDLAEHVAMAADGDSSWLLSDRRRVGVEAKHRSPEESGPTAKVADSLSKAAAARASAAWANERQNPKWRERAIESAHNHIAATKTARSSIPDDYLEASNGQRGQPDFFDKSIMPMRGPAQSDVPVVNLKDNVDYQQRAAWDQKHNPSSSQAPAETISERAPQSDFWSSLAREGRAIVDQRPPSVGQDQTQSRTLTQ